jgi:fucose permease
MSKMNALSVPQWLAVLFAFGSLMSLGWLDNARGPIYPLMIGDLSLNHSEGSAFFAVASFTAVLANFSVPFLLKHLVPKKLLFAGVVGLMMFPVVISLTSSYPLLLAAAVIFGVSLGTVGVTQNIVIEESVPAGKKRFFLSLLHSTYGLSALLAPLLVGLILSQGETWRNSLLYSLIFILPVLILGAFAIQLNPKIEDSKPSVKVLKQRLKINYNVKQLLFWGLLLAFYVSSELFFTTRLVVLLKELSGFTLQQSNMSLALFFLGLFLGRIIISFAPGNLSGRWMLAGSFILTSLSLMLCIILNLNAIWICGFFMAPVFPLAMDEISNQVGSDFGAYSSIIIALSSVGVVIMHIVVGFIFDNYGMQTALWLPLLLLSACFIMCISLWPKTNN